MDGVALLVRTLIEDGAVTALVPAERIMGGVLPQGVALPAITVTSVSRVDRHPLSKSNLTLVRQRVQVTVLAPTYEAQKVVQRQVRKALTVLLTPSFWASVPDWYAYLFAPIMHDVAVHSDSGGPDLMNEEASIYIGSDDFRVVYNEER